MRGAAYGPDVVRGEQGHGYRAIGRGDGAGHSPCSRGARGVVAVEPPSASFVLRQVQRLTGRWSSTARDDPPAAPLPQTGSAGPSPWHCPGRPRAILDPVPAKVLLRCAREASPTARPCPRCGPPNPTIPRPHPLQCGATRARHRLPGASAGHRDPSEAAREAQSLPRWRNGAEETVRLYTEVTLNHSFDSSPLQVACQASRRS